MTVGMEDAANIVALKPRSPTACTSCGAICVRRADLCGTCWTWRRIGELQAELTELLRQVQP